MHAGHYAVTVRDWRRQWYRGAAWGMLLGTMIAAGAFYAARATVVTDSRLEVACTWPVKEGEMTVVTVLHNKLLCWKWR